MYFKLYAILILFIAVLAACKKDDSVVSTSPTDPFAEYQKAVIFNLDKPNNAIILNGVINTSAYEKFKAMYEENPEVTVVNIKNCDGSIDDVVNLQLSQYVHDQKLDVHLLTNGHIASGGTDFFLSGIKRTRGKNTLMGVHSWSNGTKEATAFEKGHDNHLPYINYYKGIGFTQLEAEEFYYFTIYAASADGMHYMTEEEIIKYNMLSE